MAWDRALHKNSTGYICTSSCDRNDEKINDPYRALLSVFFSSKIPVIRLQEKMKAMKMSWSIPLTMISSVLADLVASVQNARPRKNSRTLRRTTENYPLTKDCNAFNQSKTLPVGGSIAPISSMRLLKKHSSSARCCKRRVVRPFILQNAAAQWEINLSLLEGRSLTYPAAPLQEFFLKCALAAQCAFLWIKRSFWLSTSNDWWRGDKLLPIMLGAAVVASGKWWNFSWPKRGFSS